MVVHIIQLLKFHDYVIIPGLGGFISHYEPARRSLSTNTISPPSKRLAFNQSLQDNDGLLVSQLVSNEELSQKEAMDKIRSFKATVEESLQQTGAYLFPGIGKLVYDEQQNLQFHPILKENLLLQSFGLDRVVAQPIHRIKEAFEMAKLEGHHTKPILNPLAEINTITIKSEPIYHPALFRAAAAIGILFVMTTVLMSLLKGNVSSEQLSFLPVNTNHIVLEAVEGLTTNITLEHLSPNNFLLFERKEVVNDSTIIGVSSVNPTTFYIIVGAFLNDVRMNREIASMETKGFKTATFPGPNGYTRLAIELNTNRKSQEEQLQEVRNTINADAWISTSK